MNSTDLRKLMQLVRRGDVSPDEAVERLRHLLTTRVGKIHEKKFEILPKAWLMRNDLHGAVMRAVDLTMKYYPD